MYTLIIKVGCPYCAKAITTLQQSGEKHNVIDYFKLSKQLKEDLSYVIKSMNNNNDHHTYPKIFKDNKFIGGYSELLTFLRTI